jgi:hypothetical protein
MQKQTRSWRTANEFAGDDVHAVAASCGLWHLSVHRIVGQTGEHLLEQLEVVGTVEGDGAGEAAQPFADGAAASRAVGCARWEGNPRATTH